MEIVAAQIEWNRPPILSVAGDRYGSVLKLLFDRGRRRRQRCITLPPGRQQAVGGLKYDQKRNAGEYGQGMLREELPAATDERDRRRSPQNPRSKSK